MEKIDKHFFYNNLALKVFGKKYSDLSEEQILELIDIVYQDMESEDDTDA